VSLFRQPPRSITELQNDFMAEVSRNAEHGVAEFTIAVRKSDWGRLDWAIPRLIELLRSEGHAVANATYEPYSVIAYLLVRPSVSGNAWLEAGHNRFNNGKSRPTLQRKSTDDFPDTPYSYGEQQSWLKHSVDASWWLENGHSLMAARVARRAVELAPADQMSNASVDFRIALDNLGSGAEDTAEVLPFLSETVAWLLASGWLDVPWPSYIQPPSEEAAAAWSIFPSAGISLIKRAEAAGWTDIRNKFATEFINRMNPMIDSLAWQYGEWLRNYKSGH
jgi:hypothetical protein